MPPGDAQGAKTLATLYYFEAQHSLVEGGRGGQIPYVDRHFDDPVQARHMARELSEDQPARGRRTG